MYESIDEIGAARLAKKDIPYADETGVPDYLRRHYWWAYIHPRAVQLLDRRWLINLILLGNYRRLRDATLAEFSGPSLGKVLQIACAYGDLTSKLAKRTAAQGGAIDIVDILPIQLKNLKWKMPARARARLLRMDSTNLRLADASYDWVLLFFLLHEQPAEQRAKTLSEAFRVVKPGGKVVIVDYAKPRWWNPLRYFWPVFLAFFEPFALDFWRRGFSVPPGAQIVREAFVGGLYQKVVVTR